MPETDDWLDEIFDWFERYFSSGLFEEANARIALMPVNILNEDQIVGVLCATLPAKHLLPARKEFLERAYNRLADLDLKGQVPDLFKGLE